MSWSGGGPLVDEYFAWWLQTYYRVTPDEIEPTSTPGYWQHKTPCGGARNGCREPIHGYVGNERAIRHTIQFLDSDRDRNGRFLSPYRTWRAAVAVRSERRSDGTE